MRRLITLTPGLCKTIKSEWLYEQLYPDPSPLHWVIVIIYKLLMSVVDIFIFWGIILPMLKLGKLVKTLLYYILLVKHN